MAKSIGIDLGTTTSLVSYIKNGRPHIIENKFGGRVTPSVVAIKNNKIIVGKNATKALGVNEAVREVKRLIGTNTQVTLGTKKYTPVEISAEILKSLKEDAELYLGERVKGVVITVPANFNDLQRKETKRACELAGLEVERIINEPTAAALAYGIDHINEKSNILVYDLGGGTFDVTILELNNGKVNVKASRGNNNLGGSDFDKKIVNYITNSIKNKHQIDITSDIRAMVRIREAAEEAKIQLSQLESTTIELPFITQKAGDPISFEKEITRKEFENLIKNEVNLTKNTIEEALKAAKYKTTDIDTILMIGGSTRVPLVRALVENMFNGKTIKSEVPVDEAVALGAAVQLGIKHNIEGISLEVNDTCSFTLGIATTEIRNGERVYDLFSPIIYKDTVLPCVNKESYVTVADNQTTIRIRIFQGDSEFVNDNLYIGEYLLEGLPKNKAGKEGVEVEFAYNTDGILEVKATSTTNKNIQITGKIDTSKIYSVQSK